MRSRYFIPLLCAAACAAQVTSIGIKPVGVVNPEVRDKRVAAAGPPLLGFASGPSAAELHALIGQVSKPQLGDEIAIPKTVKSLFLPPRQAYALLEHDSEQPLSVLPLRAVTASTATPSEISIAGAMAHPDLVAFSPSGRVAAVYSQAIGIQVLTELPAEPSISKSLSLGSLGVPSIIAVSDDAQILIAGFADGRVAISSGDSGWAALTLGMTPEGWSFVPRTHDLVISDTGQRTIFLVTKVEDQARVVRILAQNVQADRLALTKDGSQVVAASAVSRQVWAIDLNSGAVASKRDVPKIESISPLRDGFTFLLSTSPDISVLRLRSAQPQPLNQ